MDSQHSHVNNSADSLYSPNPHFLRHICLLHNPIRGFIDKITNSVNGLTPLASDAYLDDLNRRATHLCRIVLSHCRIEDLIIFPKLRDCLSRAAHRPLKRARAHAVSPISVDFHSVPETHSQFKHQFAMFITAIDNLRKAPISRLEPYDSNVPPTNVPKNPLADHPNHPLDLLLIPDPTTSKQVTCRQEAIPIVKKLAHKLAHTLNNHMLCEEDDIVSASESKLSFAEKNQLVLSMVIETVSSPHLGEVFRYISQDDIIKLLTFLSDCASEDEMKRIALKLAHVLPVSDWRDICAHVPKFGKMQLPKPNSLIEIAQMHKAIRNELDDIVAYCKGVDPSSQKQMQSLATRINFLRKVHSYHSEGEETVIMKELHAKLCSGPYASTTTKFREEHHHDVVLFNDFATKLNSIQEDSIRLLHNSSAIIERKAELLKSVEDLAYNLKSHMQKEETTIFPLLKEYFTTEDQDRMLRMVMANVDPEFLVELIPWMFNWLDVDDQESLLRNLMRSAPSNETCKIIGIIAQSVKKGASDRMRWNEICLRVPEIEAKYNTIVDSEEGDGYGPLSEILRVHKVFRIELNTILRLAREFRADAGFPNPLSLKSLLESLVFLRRMVADHSKAEDEILLPRLEERSPGISERYKDDHCDEHQLFQNLYDILTSLRCAMDESQCSLLVQKLHFHARVLHDDMVKHLDLEEAELWPVCRQLFSDKEQSEIVGLIFGHIPSSRLRELLPWMIRQLSVSERNTMMNHILKVTKSTMFEKWLSTWLPYDDGNHGKETDAKLKRSPSHQDNADLTLQRESEDPEILATARVMLQGRENIERTIRSIAQDSSLTVEDRKKMMQRVMLAPYNESRSAALTIRAGEHNTEDDLRKTFTTDENGVKRLGCIHYLRNCKLRAFCCQKLYTCRLCHDAAEETHVMDRSATKELLCMACGTMQKVSEVCMNEKCKMRFARYFCPFCVFYDDRNNSKVYHCPCCNVCRAGEGLGKDYFHCMECNQCMHVKYRDKGHKCLQKAMESDCPVCFQYMFTSTTPIKHLQCGHLMHTACFERYRSTSFCCPICSRSLEEMTPLYRLLDQQLAATGINGMPSHYRSAMCSVYCKDCFRRSNTTYHFVYNKCPLCQSYNTRVESIDPNGDKGGK